jgi:hypothetical protein
MDAVCTALAIMQCNRMSLEVCDVPSAYLNIPLPKGKKFSRHGLRKQAQAKR